MQRGEDPCVDSSPSELNRKILGQKLQWSVVTSHNLNSRNALVDGGITLSADLGEVKCSSVQHALSLVLFLQVLISRDQVLPGMCSAAKILTSVSSWKAGLSKKEGA